MEAMLSSTQECLTGSCKPELAFPLSRAANSCGLQARKPPSFPFIASSLISHSSTLCKQSSKGKKKEETKNAYALAPTSLSQPSVSPRPLLCLALLPERFF